MLRQGLEKTFEFIVRNVLYILLSIGVPVGYLWYNYGLVETYDAITKLKISGIIIAIIVFFFGKSYLSSFIFSMKLTWRKKAMWGLERILPLIAIYVVIGYAMQYGDTAREILLYTSISNLFAYQVAPFNVVNKKEKTGK